MTDHRGDGGGSDEWVLETVTAVHSVLGETTTPAELGTQLPPAVSTVSGHQFAWIGDVDDSAVRVRSTSSSRDFPATLDVTGTSQTERAMETGEIQVTDPTDTPEGATLQSLGTLPETARLVSVPLGTGTDAFGVLHLHTDYQLSGSAPDDLETLGTVVGQRFASLVDTNQLARERRRLETFRSMVSHDIGNPLNIASGRIELATDECDSDHLGHATDALERVEALIERGLRFVQVGKPPADRTRLSLAALASQSWDDVGTDRVTLETTDLTVTANRERFRQLLNELFRNAIDHSEGDIRVTVGPLADRSGFYVADTGPGIPAEEREYVFDLGYSTDSEHEGLGLTLVSEIAGAHGWAVRLGPPDTRGTRVEVVTDTW